MFEDQILEIHLTLAKNLNNLNKIFFSNIVLFASLETNNLGSNRTLGLFLENSCYILFLFSWNFCIRHIFSSFKADFHSKKNERAGGQRYAMTSERF